VADVPTSFKYDAMFAMDYNGSFSNNWTWSVTNTSNQESGFGNIGDREGGNGLPFASANDPRVPLIRAPMQNTSFPLTEYKLPAWMFPNDAIWKGTSLEQKNGADITIVSGIEARLIEAEAKAAAGDASFLTILNTLRTSCVAGGACATPAPAGTGGVAGLPPLVDPGTPDGRLKMVFDERGYWLYLTGHRQGDLRRLVREHGWVQDEVYPTGFYPYGGTYGEFTNIPIPSTEKKINPQYQGCFDRNA
jgi:hypothetical protein